MAINSLFIVQIFVFALACGSDKVSVDGSCTATEQSASFMAPVGQFPITILADGKFDSDQKSQILAMVKDWNQFSEKNMGHSLFQVKFTTIPETIKNINPRDCSENIGSENSFYMVKITDTNRWESLGFNNNIPGATIRCSSRSLLPNSSPQLTQQIVYLNPGKDLIDPTQFSSVVTHELGHSIGLDHSCLEGKGSANFIGCDGLKATHPYRIATMYPSLSRGGGNINPEIRNIIQANDKQRTQCLYSDQ